MPPKTKNLLCREFIKNEDLTVVPCKAVLVDFLCPNRKEHLMKYRTGFCGNGNCEGTAKKSCNGVVMRTCQWWKRCPCQCHQTYDKMYSQAGMVRVLVDNSGYEPEVHHYKMPTLEERIEMHVLSNPAVINVPVIIESPLPSVVPVTLRHGYAPTPTGIAARGELESWVKDECDAWLVEHEEFPCTPPYLSREITKTVGLGKAPSVGAISSVFDRWERIGFAIIQRKPTRFIRYTPQGVEHGLDGLKELRKRTRKFEDAATKRGVLR